MEGLSHTIFDKQGVFVVGEQILDEVRIADQEEILCGNQFLKRFMIINLCIEVPGK